MDEFQNPIRAVVRSNAKSVRIFLSCEGEDNFGTLLAYRANPKELIDSACGEDILRIYGEVEDYILPYVVMSTDIKPIGQHFGLGSWMYAEAARMAWIEAKAAIIGEVCNQGGATSLKARRVWSGSTLRAYARVEGFTAIWKNAFPQDAQVPPPPGITFK